MSRAMPPASISPRFSPAFDDADDIDMGRMSIDADFIIARARSVHGAAACLAAYHFA